MLSLVATPIGNLADITLRALETLKSADLIACEDTRHSGNLLRHYEIHKPLVSYHEHNEARRTAELIEELAAGKHIVVITDAGLPGISDPGHRLLRACIERGLPYTIIPGPSAVLTALLGSGFPAEAFFYGGFLPVKSGGRERDLLLAAAREVTSVFFAEVAAPPPQALSRRLRPALPHAPPLRCPRTHQAVRGVPHRPRPRTTRPLFRQTGEGRDRLSGQWGINLFAGVQYLHRAPSIPAAILLFPP